MEASPVIHGTIGTLLPSTEARLVDAETAQDAAAGQPGEIWVRGPQVMLLRRVLVEREREVRI